LPLLRQCTPFLKERRTKIALSEDFGEIGDNLHNREEREEREERRGERNMRKRAKKIIMHVQLGTDAPS
jgi:hypothetical protein